MASASANWRTIDVDALDAESAANFDLGTLAPAVVPVTAAEAQSTAAHIRQLLRAGDGEAALTAALQLAPYGADERGKVMPRFRGPPQNQRTLTPLSLLCAVSLFSGSVAGRHRLMPWAIGVACGGRHRDIAVHQAGGDVTNPE
jgi:ARP2/3 complex 16 kDa subunit (p16-Arc)